MAEKKTGTLWKQLLFFVAYAAIGLLIYLFKEQLDISLGTWLLSVALMTYILFTQQRVDDRIGLEHLPTLDKIIEINSAEAIAPKHERPKPLPASGWGINEQVHLFFLHFDSFANVANESLTETPWRLQEVDQTDVSTVGDDSPTIGRKYKVFHGAIWTGWVRISDGLKYTLNTPKVHVLLTIFQSRLISTSDINELASWIISLTSSGPAEEERSAYDNLRQGMIDVMWQIGPEVVTNGELEVRLGGSAERYLILAKLRPGYGNWLEPKDSTSPEAQP